MTTDTGVARPTTRGRLERLMATRRARAMMSVGLALLAWELVPRTGWPRFITPLSEVLVALWTLSSDGTLPSAFVTSSKSFVIGLTAAILVGIPLGMALGRFPRLDEILEPFVNALLALPSVAYIPVIMIWFGIGDVGRIIVVFESSFLLIAVNTRAGVRTVDPALIEMGRSFNLTRRRIFTDIVLRASTPAVFAGLRLGLQRALKGMIIAELLIAAVGLGGLVRYYGGRFQLEFVLALVLFIVAVALTLQAVLARVDRAVHRWRGVP